MVISRRTLRTKYWRLTLIILGIILISDLLRLSSTKQSATWDTSAAIPQNARFVYITSIFWNSAAILRSTWSHAIVELAEKLGTENVYISIYESGSWDDSKEELRLLETTLKARRFPHRIILDETTHEDEIAGPVTGEGWIQTTRGRKELRRIPYLSRLRNKALEPLAELAANGTIFDRVLFLNDVAFQVHYLSHILFGQR